MIRNIKILFIIPNLSAGGAERVIAFLSENIDKTIFDCRLVVIGTSKNVAYNISKTKIKFLNKQRVLFSIPNLVHYFAKEKPQIVMGSIAHLNSTLGLISVLFPKIVFVGRQAGISKNRSQYDKNKKNHIFKVLEKIGLRRLDYIICQSADMLKDCKEVFKIKVDKLKIIHNPITDNFEVKNIQEPSITKPNICRFITVGRLVQIKGHLRILQVLSSFKLPFTYTIIGNGPLKNEILEKVNSLGLKNQVRFIDFTKEVSQYLGESDYYLQGSFSEGFPNALLESCTVGTPAIAFDVPGGTKEIVENGINGFIVKNEEEFLWRLNNLKTFDPKKVSESVYKKFAKEIILKEYESFFQKIIDER